MRKSLWRLANPQKNKEIKQRYYQKNRGKILIKNRLFASLNRDKINEISRRYCHTKRANGGKYSLKEWLNLKIKYNNKCLACGISEKKLLEKEKKSLDLDHIIPIVKGGKNIISNIQPLCHSCNAKKGVQVIDYRKNYGR